MRALAFGGFVVGIALVGAASAGAADSTAGRSAMATGTAPAAQSWGGVPDVGLNRPAPAPGAAGGGWGAGGWRGGNAPPPGVGPGGPPPGGPGFVDGGRPGGWRGDGPRPGGGWQGRGGFGPDHGPGGMAWSGRYNRVGRGYVVPGYLRAPNFAVSNWWSYGLGQPAFGQNWIRYYDDALLIDGGGRVVDYRYGLDWDGYAAAPAYPDYGYGDRYEPGNYDHGFRGGHGGGVEVYRSGPGAPNVTVRSGGGGATVVIVQNPPVVTTTTTYYDEVVGAGHRGWKPAKRWRSKLRCNC